MGSGRARIDLTGRAFGYLKVVRFHHKDENSGVAIWECICTRCGKTEVLAKSYDLRHGHVKSCGCYRKASLAERCTRHGKYHTRLYKLWARLKYLAKKTHVEFDENGRIMRTLSSMSANLGTAMTTCPGSNESKHPEDGFVATAGL